MLSTSQFVSSQISKNLANEWAKFDFKSYIEEYNKLGQPSFEEKELTVRVLYRLHEFENALSLIKEIEVGHTLSENIVILKQDIQRLLDIQRELVLFKVEEVDFNSEYMEFSCAFKDGKLYYATDESKNLLIHRKDIQTNNAYLNIESIDIQKTNAVLESKSTFSNHVFNDGHVAF